MKHLAGMALMLCFLLTPSLAFSDTLLSPMPAAALAVSRLAPNSAFSDDLAPASAPAPTSPNIAPASAPSPAIPGPAPASAPSPAPAVSGLPPGPPVSTPKPANCNNSCGDIEIPYPFGIGHGCAAAWQGMAGFDVTCNDSFTPPKPFYGDFEILNITVATGEMRVVSAVSHICYSSLNTIESTIEAWSFKLASSFRISKRRNTFTAIGCSATAYLAGREDWSYYTGCMSSCVSLNGAAQDYEDCAGLGCCQIPILGNLSGIAIQWGWLNITGSVNRAWKDSPCSYAFVAEKDWYKFRREDLIRDGDNNFTSRVSSSIPVVFDWAIMSDGPCQITQDNGKTTSACASDNSHYVKATEGNGYLCNCSTGYQGNPYVPDGCTNINECELRKSNLTKYAPLYPCHSGTCEDTPGDYKCKCKLWHRGDGKSDQGCRPMVQGSTLAIVATVVSVVLACLALLLLLMKRKHRTCFHKNGGDILEKLADIKIFTKGELRNITNRYKRKIGEGYFGKVYEGTINGTQQVAVKCSREKKDARDRQAKLQHEAPRHEQEASWKDGFVKEITFQFRVSHKNVIRLLGCCLETDIPILVFEFIPNGSLSAKLHGADKPALSLSKRLDIAIGSAEALSYMHSHGEHNHVHGDLKPDNILLDRDLNPKVSDFGSSRLLSMNTYARGVATDGAYKDPVYDKTGRFTVKSDVYSFGVVLLELITRRPARYGNSSLVIDFKKSCKDKGNGREMYDTDILSDGDVESQCNIECLDMVGALGIRCLKEDAEERPTMGEVVVELMHAKSVACSTGSCNEVS